MNRSVLLGAALLATALGCSDSPTGPVAPLFDRYVALGNSITAGVQSGGIDDATQRTSYAALSRYALCGTRTETSAIW